MIVDVELLAGSLTLRVELFDYDPEQPISVDAWWLFARDAHGQLYDATEAAHPELFELIDQELCSRGLEAFGLDARVGSAVEAATEERWGL